MQTRILTLQTKSDSLNIKHIYHIARASIYVEGSDKTDQLVSRRTRSTARKQLSRRSALGVECHEKGPAKPWACRQGSALKAHTGCVIRDLVDPA